MKEKIRKGVFFVSIILVVASGLYLANYAREHVVSQRAFRELKTEDEGVDLEALHAQNPDIIGWITIDGTRIDYPVMQTPDEPEYYLRKNFEREYSIAGTPFMDSQSDLETSKNWIIYGHHMLDDTMFTSITDYTDRDFYENHKIIRFETLMYGKADYEVIGSFYANVGMSGYRYYEHPFIGTREDYEDYVGGMKARQDYDIGITPEYPNQLLTLSTCQYHTKNGRYVLVARKITPEDGQVKPTRQIKTSCNDGGRIDSTMEVPDGASAIVTFRPYEGYTLTKVRADGNDLELTEDMTEYQFSNVRENHVVEVAYEKE